MAMVGASSLTLKDLSKRLDPKHNVEKKIAEVLNETNEILDDATFMEANNITTHRSVIRTGLPEAYWRSLNRGVPKGKSETVQTDDEIGMLETWSVVDAALADLNGQKADFLLTEERAFIESMNQAAARTLFYGMLSENPAAFYGLTGRYPTLDPARSANAENVIDMGGTGGNLTSVWLMVWGDLTAHMIYPKGLPAGLKREYLGRVPVLDADNNEFMGYKSNYSWKLGLCVRDWRYCVRICNLPMDQLDDIVDNGAVSAASQKIVRAMIKAYNLIPNIRMGRPAFYMNKTVRTILDIIAAEKSNVNLTMDTIEGKTVTSFKGVPIRTVDALTGGETVVA